MQAEGVEREPMADENDVAEERKTAFAPRLFYSKYGDADQMKTDPTLYAIPPGMGMMLALNVRDVPGLS